MLKLYLLLNYLETLVIWYDGDDGDVHCAGDSVPAGSEDDGVHGAGPQQAQVCAGRGQGALPLLRLQGEVLA